MSQRLNEIPKELHKAFISPIPNSQIQNLLNVITEDLVNKTQYKDPVFTYPGVKMFSVIYDYYADSRVALTMKQNKL